MTNFLNQHIENAIRESQVSCQRLTEDLGFSLRKLASDKFASSDGLPLWECLMDGVSINCDNAWSRIFEFVENTSVVLFLDGFETHDMWRFQSGADARRMISESPPLEFYLTDDKASFILCCNHHDCIVGTGSCRDWLIKLSTQKQTD
jgi:hypothetical protein